MQDIELFCYVSLRTKPELAGKIFTLVNMEGYRSGHNGADSKSDGQGNLTRGFESHPLRQISLLIH